jgi:class 3 adenylate cyclase
MSTNTATFVGRDLYVRDLGEFEVKGTSLPVGVFELVGRGQQ